MSTPGPKVSEGPTGPGGGLPPNICQQEYERGFLHGQLAGARSPGAAGVSSAGCKCGDREFSRFLVGLSLGTLLGVLLGLFLGLFLANVLTP